MVKRCLSFVLKCVWCVRLGCQSHLTHISMQIEAVPTWSSITVVAAGLKWSFSALSDDAVVYSRLSDTCPAARASKRMHLLPEVHFRSTMKLHCFLGVRKTVHFASIPLPMVFCHRNSLLTPPHPRCLPYKKQLFSIRVAVRMARACCHSPAHTHTHPTPCVYFSTHRVAFS